MKSKTKWFLSTKKNVTLPSYIRLILPRFQHSNLQISGLKIGTLSYRALSFVFTDKSELPLVLLLQPYPKHFQIFLFFFFFFFAPSSISSLQRLQNFYLQRTTFANLMGSSEKGWNKNRENENHQMDCRTQTKFSHDGAASRSSLSLSLSLSFLKVSPPQEERIP